MNWLMKNAYMYNENWAVYLSNFVNVLQTKSPCFTVIIKERIKKLQEKQQYEHEYEQIKQRNNRIAMNSQHTLKISNQNVSFTGYRTRMPDRIALWRTTPRSFCNRAARCNVGPLPTDWPYKMRSSCFIPYSFFKQSYTASMSQYVLNSDGFWAG